MLTHKSLARQKFAGDPSARLELTKLEARIASQLKDVEDVDARLTDQLHTSMREMKDRSRGSSNPSAIRESWEQLLKVSDAKVDEESHVKLIADIRNLVTHVGDSSKLILDPDLDTYYLMDALLLKEPDIVDRTSQMGDQVAQILARKAITLEERENLAGEVALLRAAADGLKTDVDTSISETNNFNHNGQLRAALMPDTVAVMADVDALLSLTTERVVRQQSLTVDGPTTRGRSEARSVQCNSGGRFDVEDRMLRPGWAAI